LLGTEREWEGRVFPEVKEERKIDEGIGPKTVNIFSDFKIRG